MQYSLLFSKVIRFQNEQEIQEQIGTNIGGEKSFFLITTFKYYTFHDTSGFYRSTEWFSRNNA